MHNRWNPSCTSADPVPTNGPGKMEAESPGAWDSATHVGDPAGNPGSRLWLGLVQHLTSQPSRGANQQMKDLSLFLYFPYISFLETTEIRSLFFLDQRD